jgi:hypothetical protein
MRIYHFALAALALLFLPAVACKTPAPKSDSTPPKLEWVVRNADTNVSQTFNGSGTVNAKRGESYKVTLKAIDPEGIHEITLGGSASWTCASGSVGQNKIADFITKKQTLNPDSMGNVLTQIFLLQDANFDFGCQAGFTFKSGSEELLGTGENYFGGKTNGTLTFQVKP